MNLLASLQRWLPPVSRVSSRLAGLLLAAAIICGAVTPTAQAQFATGGSGIYRSQIYWIDWGSAGTSIPQLGQTVTQNITVAGQTLVLTCTINGISGSGTDPDLAIYRPGDYFEDGLDNLYNIGGIGTGDPGTNPNTMNIGLINRTASTNATFTFSCGMTLGGVSFPLDGLVFADAETTSETESTVVTLPAGATMRVIERLREANCDEPYYVDVSGTTYTFRTGIAPVSGSGIVNACYGTAPFVETSAMAVGFLDNATSATVKIVGGGKQAVALGVMLNIADYGDAPSTYGNVAHIPQLNWTSGTLSTGTNPIFPATTASPAFTLGTQTQPTSALLGSTVDLESAQQFNAGATGDDSTGIDDETSVTFPTMKRGTTATVPVVIGGVGRLNAWIDWNGDGDFADSGEQIATDQSVLAGTTNLSVTIPSTAVLGTTFARFRICTVIASCTTPTGVSASGEVEDYSLSIVAPILSVTKTSNGPWVPGQTGATYTLTPSNSAGTAATNGTVTVIDVLPSGITPGWTGTQTTNGWSCTFVGQTVTCTSTTSIAVGANGTDIVVPVNVSGAAGTATNYASIGGGGDTRNSGVAPTPGASCTPSGMCTSVDTILTAAPPLACTANLYGIFGNASTTTNVQSLSLANVLGTPSITTIPTSTSNAAMAISTSGDKIFVMGSDYVLRVYDIPTNTWATAGTLSGYVVIDGRPLRMAIGPDGTGYVGMSGSLWTFSQTSPYTLSSVKTVSYTDTSGLSPTPFLARNLANNSAANGDFFVDSDNNLYLMANPNITTLTPSSQNYLDLFLIQGATGASPVAKFFGRFLTPATNTVYTGIAALSGGLYVIGFGGEMLSIDLASKTINTLTTNTSTIGSDLGSCYYPSLRPLITSTKTVTKTAAGSTDTTGDTRAFAGDTLTYTIVVRNSGTLVATGVSFQDIIPAGTTYVASSATLNTVPVTDATGGVMPYVAGKVIKSPSTTITGQLEVDSTPGTTTDKEATITFKVKVNAGTTSVSNTGAIQYNDDATGTGTVATLNTNTTTTPVYFFDYGEDPNSAPGTLSANSYKTLFAEDGARHVIDSIRLGSTVNADTNGSPVVFGTVITATDNDGVIFNATAGIPTLLNMQNSSTTANTVTVTASAAGFLNAWIDYNQNGLFDTTEKIFADTPVVAGANTLTFNIASATISGLTYARFRVTTGSGQATLPTGLAPNGEVEDYAVKLTSSVSNTSTCVANPPNTVGLNFRWFDTATSTSSFRRFQRVGALADGTLLDLELTSSLPVTVGGPTQPLIGTQQMTATGSTNIVYTIKFFVSGTNTPINVSVANLITDVDGEAGTAGTTVGNPAPVGAGTSEHVAWKASQIFEAQYNSNAQLYLLNNPFTGVASAASSISYDKMVVGKYGNAVGTTGTNDYPDGTAKAVRLVTKEVSSFDWLYYAGQFGGSTIDLTGKTSIVADCPPILNLAKSSSASSWTVGQSGATYTLTATNSGPKATSGTVTLTDKLPTGITVPNGAVTLSGTNAANWACTAASNTLTCTSSTVIAASGTSTFTFPVTVGATATGTLTNYASISGGGDASTLTNANSASCAPSNLCASANTSITTVSIPNVTLLKLVRNVTNATTFVSTNVSVKPKDIVEYCIAYENTGGNAANFVLTDYVPFGMVIVPDAYGTGKGVRWSSTTKAAIGDAAAPTGTNLTNITDSPTPDQGTFNNTSVVNPSDPVGSSSHPGLMTLNLGATGLTTAGKGTVCFQTQVP